MKTVRLSVLGPRYVLPGKSTHRFVHIKTFGLDCYFQMGVTTHLVRHLPSSGQECFFFFADSPVICYLQLSLSFCAVAVSGGRCWRLSV